MANEVLIINATKTESFFLKGLLNKLGTEVSTAHTREEAASVLSGREFRMVFIDERLKGTNGYEVYEKLRMKNLLLDTNIVFVGEGNDDYSFTVLKRPIEYRRLSEIVQKCLAINPNINPFEGMPDWLAAVTELDHESAIKICGSVEGYLAALEIFMYTIKEKSDEIEKFYNDDNIKDYTIKVHALKSSSLIVGANELSELAKSLEMAGKEGDTDLIHQETGRLLEMYRSYQKILAPMGGDEETSEEDAVDDRETVDPAVLEDAYASIKEFAEAMDIDLVEMVLKSLEDYRFEPEDEEKIGKLRRYAFDLDWEAIKALL